MPICVIRLWPFTTRPDPAAARPADLVKRNFVADAEGPLDVCQTLLERREAIAVVLGQPGPSWREARTALNDLARIVRQA